MKGLLVVSPEEESLISMNSGGELEGEIHHGNEMSEFQIPTGLRNGNKIGGAEPSSYSFHHFTPRTTI
jgi:hypothetical protein